MTKFIQTGSLILTKSHNLPNWFALNLVIYYKEIEPRQVLCNKKIYVDTSSKEGNIGVG